MLLLARALGETIKDEMSGGQFLNQYLQQLLVRVCTYNVREPSSSRTKSRNKVARSVMGLTASLMLKNTGT